MILIGLGANLSSKYGKPEDSIKLALRYLNTPEIRLVTSSGIWKSAPVPISDQPWYYNAVCLVETDLSPSQILENLHQIEHRIGRVRSVRNAPRVIDMDLLAYNNKIINEPDLIIPHPRMPFRAFVLYPLQEITADWRHPHLNKSLSELIEDLPENQRIEKLFDSCKDAA